MFLMGWLCRPSLSEAVAAVKRVVQLIAYGPGGPRRQCAIAAKVFGAGKGIAVNITAVLGAGLEGQAMKNADLIFSGSENMMTNYVRRTFRG
jgi:accessory colonization factor AcfC